jgi:hypothetical protein
MPGSVTGLLIQAALGILGALGRWVKRRGFAAQAAFGTAWRLSWIADTVPICTEYGPICTEYGVCSQHHVLKACRFR